MMAMPRLDVAAVTEADIRDLEQVWDELDLPGHRIDLIDGQIVVSPRQTIGHSAAISHLMGQIFAAKRQHSWHFLMNLAVYVPATGERLMPDLIIAPEDAPAYDDEPDSGLLLACGVLLVAEVVSASTHRQDRVVKPRAYAQGDVPLYLIIDNLADPPAAILLSQPGEHGYAQTQAAQAGEPLELPEPFGLSLDTKLLLP